MNLTQVLAHRIIAGSALLLVVMGLPVLSPAQPATGWVEVRAMDGKASWSTNGGTPEPLVVGTTLHAGSVVKTGPNSQVDLFFSPKIGLVRLTENSTLAVDQLSATETGADTKVEVELSLPDGDMYFRVNKLSKASRYEVKMPNGVAGIRGTQGRFSFRPQEPSRPPVVLLEGQVVFVHAPAGGVATTHMMNAPPSVYFNSTEGVKPTPPGLQGQVEQQLEQAERRNSRRAERASNDNDQRSTAVTPVEYLSPGTGTRRN